MQSRMRKSSSLAAMRIDFNPSQFTVGESKITNLASNLDTKRNLLGDNANSKEVERLRTLNSQYFKQNQRLKKENQSLRSCLTATNKPKTKEHYKDILQQSRCNSRIPTQCETGLFSSKEISLENNQNPVEEYYKKFSSRGFHINLKQFQQLTRKFFKEYQENYSMLSYMIGKVTNQQKRWKQLKELVQIYKVPLVYTKNPRLLLRELSRQKSANKKPAQVCLEMVSPDQTIKNFEGLLKKLQKSSKIMGNLRTNETVKQFLFKCI